MNLLPVPGDAGHGRHGPDDGRDHQADDVGYLRADPGRLAGGGMLILTPTSDNRDSAVHAARHAEDGNGEPAGGERLGAARCNLNRQRGAHVTLQCTRCQSAPGHLSMFYRGNVRASAFPGAARRGAGRFAQRAFAPPGSDV